MDFVVIDGNIKYGFKHSYIADGKSVDYAGQIDFDGNGNIISWSNQSGHYQPDADSKNNMSDLFQKKYGINLNNINFINIIN